MSGCCNDAAMSDVTHVLRAVVVKSLHFDQS